MERTIVDAAKIKLITENNVYDIVSGTGRASSAIDKSNVSSDKCQLLTVG